MRHRLRRRLRKIVGWGTLLLVAALIGGGWFAYWYATDSETLRSAIRDGAPKFLPGSLVDVSRVRVRPFAGEVILHSLSVRKFEDGGPVFVGSSPWVQITYDAWGMTKGRFDIKEVVVAQPRLRLRRRKDGTWNIAGLLADPWPMPPSESSPPVRIENGTVELVDEADGPDAVPAAILRDVSVRITPGDLKGTPIKFDGSARGDFLERVEIAGGFDRASGRLTLAGDLRRLAISNALGERLPAQARPAFAKLGLTGGDADVTLRSLVLETKTGAPPRYDATARISSGVWKCNNLPFALSELAATIKVKDGVATIERAEGRNGTTTVHASGTVGLADPATAPFRLAIGVDDLELDERVKDWSIKTFAKVARDVYNDFRPGGRIDVDAEVGRGPGGGPIDWVAAVGCRDVSFEYKEFRYPLEHVRGKLICKPDRITVDAFALVGGRPFTAKGTIDRPGPKSIIDLDFAAEALPVDKALIAAMPPDVKKVVNSFQPSGTVKGSAHIRRTPPARPGDDPVKGVISIDALLDLNPGCEITWEGLKYPVRDLTGRLEIHPTSWIFKEMHGSHGQATITGDGRVDKLGRDQYKVAIHVNAANLPFEEQLRDALQPAWLKTWNTLNPTGASDVDVRIGLEPGKPDDYHLEIKPRPETNLRLKFERVALEGDGDGARRIELPMMEGVQGLFVFHNGKVAMTHGRFLFRGAPVKFEWGEVEVADTGKFALRVKDLSVDDFKLDADLRKLMPPLMARFAVRLDDGKSFRFRSDLALGWSGKTGEPATCAWQNGTVVFTGNSVLAGIPLKFIQGQADGLNGSFDGRALVVRGALNLESVNLFDLQLTNLETPIELVAGKLTLANIKGTLMKGTLTGSVEVNLDATPRFETHLKIEGADLESYAKAVAGKQRISGKISGEIHLTGLGQDLHSLQGQGEAHAVECDLGKLPAALRVVSLLNLAPNAKTVFDKADVWFTIRNGQTTFNPIQFTGYAFSLHGRGTVDVQGDLDIKLRVLYGRDAWHFFLVSDAVREASGQIFVIRVSGTPGAPVFKPEPLPQAIEFARSFGKGPKPPRDPAPKPPARLRRLGLGERSP